MDAIPKAVCTSKVTIEGSRVELGKNEHFVNTTVDTIAHWHIDQPICPTDWHLLTQVMQA